MNEMACWPSEETWIRRAETKSKGSRRGWRRTYNVVDEGGGHGTKAETSVDRTIKRNETMVEYDTRIETRVEYDMRIETRMKTRIEI